MPLNRWTCLVEPSSATRCQRDVSPGSNETKPYHLETTIWVMFIVLGVSMALAPFCKRGGFLHVYASTRTSTCARTQWLRLVKYRSSPDAGGIEGQAGAAGLLDLLLHQLHAHPARPEISGRKVCRPAVRRDRRPLGQV